MILFNATKHETHHAKANFRLLARKLRVCAKIKNNKTALTSDLLNECEAFIIGNPQDPFTDEELKALRAYINRGGSVVVFASEGGESKSHSNLNDLLNGFGIRIDNSCVVRSVYHKYHHPKHALIANGVVQPEIGYQKDMALTVDSDASTQPSKNDLNESSTSLTFVYPYGTTLAVEGPSLALLSSGSTSYPVDCPIAAAWEGDKVGNRPRGKLLVVGSVDIFSDSWIEKEENNELCNVLFRFLLHQHVSFDPSIGRADFEEKEIVPCISTLANLVKPCIHEYEPLPQDCKSLLIEDLFCLKMDHVTDVIDLYKQLNVPYEPLSLIEPHFECPHPPLKMATHKPRMIEPSPPALELFDLDECVLDIETRLNKLANKYRDGNELDMFVEEAGLICIPEVCEDDEWRINGTELSKYLLHHMTKKVRFDIIFVFSFTSP